MGRMTGSVFISYSKTDEPAALEVCDGLEKAGITCWIAPRDITPGMKWPAAIRDAIAGSLLVVVVWSRHAQESDEVPKEVSVANRHKKIVVPWRLENLELSSDFEYQLSDVQWVDAFQPPVEARLSELIEAARELLERNGPPAPVDGPTSGRTNVSDKSKAVWSVRRRNPNFTGRAALLSEIGTRLGRDGNSEGIVAIVGPPGFGKTQLAVEYAYTHRRDYSIACSVTADDQTTLVASFAGLAPVLGLPDEAHQDEAVEAVRARLEQSHRWLLILDNAEIDSAGNDVDVDRVLPQGGGHVLITSRQSGWRAVGADVVDVELMTISEAVEFLQERTGQSDKTAATQLAEALYGYPLALEQAGAYIEQNGNLRFSKYLELFQQQAGELLRRGKPHDYATAVIPTWTLAFAQVEQASPDAVELFDLCAFLAPDDIPLDVLAECAGDLPEPVSEILRENLRREDAVGVLAGYSYVSRTNTGVAVHRIVQQLARERLPKDTQRQRLETAVRVVLSAFPENGDDVQQWANCRVLLPHVSAIRGHARQLAPNPLELARLLDRAGVYLHSRAQFADARSAFDDALSLIEAQHGDRHPVRATVLNHLGGLLRELGDADGAERNSRAALAVHEEELGADAREVGDDLVNLARALIEQDELTEAKAALERALSIHESAFGSTHRAVAEDTFLLFDLDVRAGNLVDGVLALDRASAVYEAMYGPDHPDVAGSRYVRGLLSGAQEEPLSVREKLERVVSACAEWYGNDHPTVGDWRKLLADLLLKINDFDGAAANYAEALRIDTAAYSSRHRRVAKDLLRMFVVAAARDDSEAAQQSLEQAELVFRDEPGAQNDNGRAFLAALDEALDALGEIPAATSAFERIVGITEETCGVDSAAVASALDHFGVELSEARELQRAKENLERALSIFEQRYRDQPRLGLCLNRLGTTQQALGDLPGAKASFLRALEIDDKPGASQLPVLADLTSLYSVLRALDDHPAASRTLDRIVDVSRSTVGVEQVISVAEALRETGDLESARRTHEQALEILEGTYGKSHPQVAAELNRLGAVLSSLEDWKAASDCYGRAVAIHTTEYGADHFEVGGDLYYRLFPVLSTLGEFDAARETLDRALAIFEKTLGHDHPNVSSARTLGWLNMGDSAVRLDLSDGARTMYEFGLAGANDAVAQSAFHARLGGLAAADGDLARAVQQFQESVTLLEAGGSTDPFWDVVHAASPAVRRAADRRTLEEAFRLLREDPAMQVKTRTFRPELTALMPESWFAKESMTLLSPDGQANVIASGEPLDPTFDSKRYAEVQNEALLEFSEYKQLQFEEIELLGGRRGYIRHFEWTPPDGVRVSQIQLYYAEGGRGYTATATTPTSHFPDVELELRQLLTGLRIDPSRGLLTTDSELSSANQ